MRPVRSKPYVRGSGELYAKAQARKRREENRRWLAECRTEAGAMFDVALEWLRLAARYAGQRSYRSGEAGERGFARRDQIRDEAARVVQAVADEIAKAVPVSFRPSPNRAAIRAASSQAATPKERLDLARAWQMNAYRLVCRYAHRDGGTAKAAADRIRDEVATRLADWAEEMDADDYCQ